MLKFSTVPGVYRLPDFDYHLHLVCLKNAAENGQSEESFGVALTSELNCSVRAVCQRASEDGCHDLITAIKDAHFLGEKDFEENVDFRLLQQEVNKASGGVDRTHARYVGLLKSIMTAHQQNTTLLRGQYYNQNVEAGRNATELLDNRLKTYWTARDKVATQYYRWDLFEKGFSRDQKNEAVRALQSVLKGESVDLTPHLATLRNGKLGKQLRNFVKEGFADEIVGRKCTTIRDFVAALESNRQLFSPNDSNAQEYTRVVSADSNTLLSPGSNPTGGYPVVVSTPS
jgi:hypothetical protein